ncbi:Glucose-repressible alcohol dehydrogenase transcriptional effector [Mortierella alpina]|nr:Glucose-repressible alcohol dehydrogenase transcriptional effector [Mortierella alpina]
MNAEVICLTVVSYNLLSNTLAMIGDTFRKNAHVPDPLQWESRRALLLTEIEGMDADVLCLQELDEPDYDGHLGTRIRELGYCSVYSKRSSDHVHGFAVFYKFTRVKLVDKFFVPCPNKNVVNGVERAGILLVVDVEDVLTGDMNSTADSLVLEYVLKGLVDLSSVAEENFSWSRSPFSSGPVDENHLSRVKVFKSETLELRDLVPPMASAYPKAKRSKSWTADPVDFAAPVVSAYVPKSETLRHMIKTHRDLEDHIVTHPLQLKSVYNLQIVDFILYGEMTGCAPRLELVSRLELSARLVQLKAGLPAAYLGSDHYAIGAQYRFRE